VIQDSKKQLRNVIKYVLLKANPNEQALPLFCSDEESFQPHENRFVFERLRIRQKI
jgi:hypothetical protein